MAIDAEFTQYSNNEWIVNFKSGNVSEPQANLESILQAVRFALETERFMYPIMGSNFGMSWSDLIGADYDFLRSEVVSRVKDALSIDDRIISVGDFNFVKQDDSVLITMIVKTTVGDVNASTKIIS